MSDLRKTIKNRGFTLIELLVVVAIISLLLTFGAAAIRGAGGENINTAVSATEALFSEAKSMAVGKGTRARVLVDIDSPQDDSYLKRVILVSEELDDNGEGTGNWIMSNRGYFLPEGVYYSKDFSFKDHDGNTGEIDEMDLTGISGTYDGTYAYYEFNREGICTTGAVAGGDYTGPSFVLGRGVRPLGGEPRTTSDGRRDFGGFVIWRNGSTSKFRDPTQIIGNSDPQSF